MRWLWALPVVAMGLFGLGQVLSGEWSAELRVLPSPNVNSTALTLTYSVPSWSGTSESYFTLPWGWVWEEFRLKGALGPVAVHGHILFGPLIPDFLYAQAIGTLAFGGTEVELHTAMIGPALGGPLGGVAIRATMPLGGDGVTLTAGFGASLPADGFTIYHVSGLCKTYATEPRPGGSSFTQATVSLTGVPLCCGMAYDAELTFLKSGFDYLKFVAKDIPLCCGISFDAAVKFSVTSKTVTLTPRWAGIVGCLTVYGDARWQTPTNTFEGLVLYGFKIRCALAECTYIEFLTAFDVTKVEEILEDADLFQGQEFEYVKLGFCGAGCCGGRYAVDVAAYFRPAGRSSASAGSP